MRDGEVVGWWDEKVERNLIPMSYQRKFTKQCLEKINLLRK